MALLNAGWRVATVWECALLGKGEGAIAQIADRLAGWLESGSSTLEIAGWTAAGEPEKEP